MRRVLRCALSAVVILTSLVLIPSASVGADDRTPFDAHERDSADPFERSARGSQIVECPTGLAFDPSLDTCTQLPTTITTLDPPSCPWYAKPTIDRTSCHYVLEPAVLPFNAACPLGFRLTGDGVTCGALERYTHVVDPPRCVPSEGGQIGQLTGDRRDCVVSYLPFIEMQERAWIMDAIDEPASPGQQPAPFVACPTGYELSAGDICSAQIQTPDTTFGVVAEPTMQTSSCVDGILAGDVCQIELPDASGAAVYVPAGVPVDVGGGSMATCNGYQVDYADPELCVATGTVLITVPAAIVETPSDITCPEGSELGAGPNSTTCFQPNDSVEVQLVAAVVTPDSLYSCPPTFAGPSANLQCNRGFTLPQESAGCVVGELRLAKPGGPPVDCRLGAPLVSQPVLTPTCRSGSFDAALWLCTVAAVEGDFCEGPRIAMSTGCVLLESSAECSGTVADVGSQVLCLVQPLTGVDASGDAGWQTTAIQYECAAGSIDLNRGVCAADRVPVVAPGICAGHTVTVQLGLGETPTDGPDVIMGTPGNDAIGAGAGNDIICGNGGNDSIWGQEGNDVILGGTGDDFLSGGDGNDIVVGFAGADNLKGGRGNDGLWGGDGDDVALRGGTGDDYVNAGQGSHELVAGNGGTDYVVSFDGDDKLTGGPRFDYLVSLQGVNLLKGNGGSDVLAGGGQSELRGGPGRDLLFGQEGAICNGGNTAVDPGEPPSEFDWADSCSTRINIP